MDAVAADAQAFEALVRHLAEAGSELTRQPEERRISIPAPDELADLQRVSVALAGQAVHVDEIALRRPTLDDVFMTLTGHPAEDRDASTTAPQEAAACSPMSANRRF